MNKDKSEIVLDVAISILNNDIAKAKAIIDDEYPHEYFEVEKRTYTMAQKMGQFIKDGFIDRYTGQKLLNPGMLKVIS